VAKTKYPVVQVTDDTWYALRDYSRDICCHCCLVHDQEWKIENGQLFFKVKVNARETAKQRKLHGIKVTSAGT
jgi:acetone carboxylase gamma subunit